MSDLLRQNGINNIYFESPGTRMAYMEKMFKRICT